MVRRRNNSLWSGLPGTTDRSPDFNSLSTPSDVVISNPPLGFSLPWHLEQFSANIG